MVFKVTHLRDGEIMAGTFTADRRLWLTADRSRVVEEGDPAAATLFCSVGRAISTADAERLNISQGSDGKLSITKKKKAPEDKMKAAPEDKATKKKKG